MIELPVIRCGISIFTMDVDSDQSVADCFASIHAARKSSIINVTSVTGKISYSPLTAYSASKFALEALSEALAGEMKPFGVRVAIVQPGIIATAMPHAIADVAPSPYRQVGQLAALFAASLEHPVPPSVVATAIRGIIESGTWKLRHPVGPDAEPFLGWCGHDG